MSYRWTLCLVVISHLLIAGPVEAKKKISFNCHPLTEDLTLEAIAVGAQAKGRNCGLSLKDSAQGFANAMASMGNGQTGTTGFSLDIYTPFSWIAQNSSWESKKYKQMSPEQITEEMVDPVLRVYANPDVPTRVNADGMIGSSGVEHIIIRNTKKKNFEVLQPLEIQEDVEYARNAFGAEVAYSSMVGYFDLEEVIRISKLDKKGEFFIVVIGTTGEEKKFKVKTKHFGRLP